MATDPAFDAGDAAALVSQAGGNPLHLRELVNLGHTAVPPSLQAVLAARLDAIPVTDKAVLQAVSIFSDGAAPSEVAAITGSDVQESLDRLATAGLLAEHDGRHLVADPLLREVAYEQMTHTARGDRHRRAAAVASTSLGRARHLGLAARYLPDDAELRQQAATELGRAGVELLAVSHVRDGLQLLRRGLELGLDDPEALLQLAETE